ncbi:MAG: hypothetical protein MRERC_1c220 [Mycoplasmataceae bacterium RC_NB112A]|nr:MAG: hypothetical protein MRERC_1c220 [Mycoplasmataceae bacterium RC_NB112A]
MTEIRYKLVIEKVTKAERARMPANVKILEIELTYPTQVELNIKSLKEKKGQAPNNSNKYQDCERKIKDLESKLAKKEKAKEKTQKGDNFPWKPVIIEGLVVGGVIIVLVIVLLLKKIVKK